MIPSNIPRAIRLLNEVAHRIDGAKGTRFICHALEDTDDPVAFELRDYIRAVLWSLGGTVIECVLPNEIQNWLNGRSDNFLQNAMRAAWCDKMAYDLTYTGELP